MEPRLSMCLCGFVVLFACVVLCGGDIRDSLKNWQFLTVSGIQRRTVKRDTAGAHPAEQLIKFDSFGRHFALFLRKNFSILAPGFKIFVFEANGSSSEVQLDLNLYRGSVEGDENSFVSAYFDDQQVLSASIQTSEETYVIEPASNLIPNSSNETMIIYKGSDLKWDNSSRCGYINEQKNSVVMNKSISEDRLLARSRKAACTSFKDTCQLYISADPNFVRTKGRKKIKTTAAYLLKTIDYVDSIYRKTEFPGCGKHFGFEVKIMNIFSSPTEGYPYTEAGKSYTYNNYLDVFGGDKELKEVCLGHLFTHQAFQDEGSFVLGLAYMADPHPTKYGGVCSRTKRSNRNVGWTTYLGGFDTITDLQGTLVTAHELGHNWGAAHDPETNEECAPKSSNYGKFIMYPASVSGRDRNNHNFSHCSLMAMGAVLSVKSDCFQEKRLSFCGNHIVETGEQCDEGLDESHSCCDNRCKLRENAVCSNANDACCSPDCQVIRSKLYGCFTPSFEECLRPAFCDGVSSKCPAPLHKPDASPCAYKGKCFNGECINLCPQHNYESCMCDTVREGCTWCCRKNDGKCSPLVINGTVEFLPPGMVCVGGMCDRQGRCRPIVANFVARLFDILDLSSPAAFAKFMKNNVAATIIILSLLIWIPATCYVCYLDRRDKKEQLEMMDKTADDVLDGKETSKTSDKQ